MLEYEWDKSKKWSIWAFGHYKMQFYILEKNENRKFCGILFCDWAHFCVTLWNLKENSAPRDNFIEKDTLCYVKKH